MKLPGNSLITYQESTISQDGLVYRGKPVEEREYHLNAGEQKNGLFLELKINQ